MLESHNEERRKVMQQMPLFCRDGSDHAIENYPGIPPPQGSSKKQKFLSLTSKLVKSLNYLEDIL